MAKVIKIVYDGFPKETYGEFETLRETMEVYREIPREIRGRFKIEK